MDKVGQLVQEIQAVNPNLKAYTFINRADPRGQDNNEAAEVLKETEALIFLDSPIGSRKAFGNAASTGLSVTELTPKDTKAHNEITTLYQYVFNVKITPTLEAVGE